MKIIKSHKLKHVFYHKDENGTIQDENIVLNDVNIEIEKGEFVAILGHNGSGKSTFAKHLNALLLPTEGTVLIDGNDTEIEDKLLKIRQTCGMVFQNPDNQIIGATVEEDIGFGPENIGVPTKEIWKRVNDALDCVEMNDYRTKSPNRLSGGQKQRVSIASVLAMKPKCIVLDEPTAMLDPVGRKEVMKTLHILNEQENITIILITHHMDEAIQADKVYVMNKGQVELSGTPKEVFSQVERIKQLKLEVPQVTELSYKLYQKGVFERYNILTIDEFIEELNKIKNHEMTGE